MKKLKTGLAAKLKSKAGESLAEVLIALLIAALALTMLASVIHTSATMINNSKKNLGDYYAENQHLEKMDSGATPGSCAVTKPGAAEGSSVTINLLPAPAVPEDGWMTVDCFVNNEISNRPVAAYRLHR